MANPVEGIDMTNRTCDVDGCDRPHAARGMCGPHYGTWHRRTFGRNDLMHTKTCIMCGRQWETRRNAANFCSDTCKGEHYSATMRRKSMLPPEHPVMLLIAEARKPKPKPARVDLRTARECPACACWFSPLLHCAASQMVACSDRCSRKLSRRRRRAREHNTLNQWRWSDFMRIARKFDNCCAYCGVRPGALDPDHVVPLSRGGADAIANLLPSCRQCNGDKRDLLLHEWAADRAERNKPARVTTWSVADARYTHLTVGALAVAAV